MATSIPELRRSRGGVFLGWSAREENMKLSLLDISIRPCLLALASVLILPMPASYAGTALTTNLTGALEIPSNASTATGTGVVVTLESNDLMRVEITFSGRELQRPGEKTLEAEILKEALEHATGSKKQLRLPSSPPKDGSR